MLAQESIDFLNTRHFSPSRAAKILVGLNLRDYLKGIRSLMKSNLDNQALVLYRSLIENFLVLEYLSRMTFRGKRKLTPAQKGLLFILFPTFVRGMKDSSFQTHPLFKKAKSHRLRHLSNHKYWHGSNLHDICVELDKLRKDGKTPNLDTYLELYSHLSFVSHPNSRESGYFETDPNTGIIHLKPHFHLDSTGFLQRCMQRDRSESGLLLSNPNSSRGSTSFQYT
jgi:hypothetical protein